MLCKKKIVKEKKKICFIFILGKTERKSQKIWAKVTTHLTPGAREAILYYIYISAVCRSLIMKGGVWGEQNREKREGPIVKRKIPRRKVMKRSSKKPLM